MSVRSYNSSDFDAVLSLWNTAGVDGIGYAPQTAEGLKALIFENPFFCPEHSFVSVEGDQVIGFVNGTTGDSLSRGAERGYVSCVLLADGYNTADRTEALLSALEDSFRAKGKIHSAVTCFNPIRLPWIIPGTPGHQHNNMPGIARDIPLYDYMTAFGYVEGSTEQAMYFPLERFEMPEEIRAVEARMAAEGRFVDWYREGVHEGLDEMVETLQNTMWSEEVPAAGHSGMKLLVGLEGNTVSGFTGPVYPEVTGRGYFAGIAVGPGFRGHGYGKLLFYKLCQAEKDCGAAYMSLFTGLTNPAQNIYKKVGFEVRRYFAVMIKDLTK